MAEYLIIFLLSTFKRNSEIREKDLRLDMLKMLAETQGKILEFWQKF